ncbi:WD40/YVTN/BNR-like repeat-containing protein [Haloarcula sp. NS06]|uniref:WD40/YVTN/BNR-like repeat-containing protein n=1 Tax=Haloarcula sp. NS06 TaxID=3409688 RepID=UPI003DA72BF6
MSDRNATRRGVLKGIGATAAAALGGAALSGTVAAAGPWESVESPTGNTLHDVEYTTAGAYAVAGGGIVLERTSTGWQKVIGGGPTGNGNSLYGADVTDDGKALWFVGASGAIGEYDVESGVLTDHSAPMDVTNNFNDVSVTGTAGEANVYVAGDSGKMYYSFENGASETWDYTTPGSGSAINAVDFHGVRSGHIVDGNKSVFVTDDGATWNKIGLADANVNFYGVDSDGPDDVWVSGGGGMIFHWNGSEWMPTDTGDAGLRDIEVTDDDSTGYTVGGGGKVYALSGGDWTQEETPAGENLKAVVRGGTDIAVGSGGTILEK